MPGLLLVDMFANTEFCLVCYWQTLFATRSLPIATPGKETVVDVFRRKYFFGFMSQTPKIPFIAGLPSYQTEGEVMQFIYPPYPTSQVSTKREETSILPFLRFWAHWKDNISTS